MFLDQNIWRISIEAAAAAARAHLFVKSSNISWVWGKVVAHIFKLSSTWNTRNQRKPWKFYLYMRNINHYLHIKDIRLQSSTKNILSF